MEIMHKMIQSTERSSKLSKAFRVLMKVLEVTIRRENGYYAADFVKPAAAYFSDKNNVLEIFE